jgi:class 3 adenylate cyclase
MDVPSWLLSLGLEQYESLFRENDIHSDLLRSLTAEDLKELGITSVGHRRRLVDAINALQVGAVTSPPVVEVENRKAPGPEGARRQLTVMFCDLVGSTALSSRLDPEDLREILAAYHAAVAEVGARFGGFVAQYMGDGALVYFGYPQAHEYDAERAVRAGLALVERIGRLQSGFGALKSRVGIATGLVVVGDLIGSGQAQQRGVVGETPNLAARLQGMAPPNAVLIADSTRRLVQDLFDYRDLGMVEVKGLAEPVPAWHVLRESRIESRFEALRSSSRRSSCCCNCGLGPRKAKGRSSSSAVRPASANRGLRLPCRSRSGLSRTIGCAIFVRHIIRAARSIRSSPSLSMPRALRPKTPTLRSLTSSPRCCRPSLATANLRRWRCSPTSWHCPPKSDMRRSRPIHGANAS